MLVAHSQNDAREWHGLTDHLDKVATLAATFSAEWGDTLWAGLAGAWHDLGKTRLRYAAAKRTPNGATQGD